MLAIVGTQLALAKRYAYSDGADGDWTNHRYLTQGGKVIRETIGTGSTARVLDFIYNESGRPFAVKDSQDGGSTFATYYYVLNHQGDVVKLINSSSSVVASYTYNAWGEILTATGTMADINPLRYRGYYYDSETGWYYLQSRYYDPVMHRFINADSFASTGAGILGCNMFAYCNNNPIIYSDTTGQWIDIAWDFVSLLWGVADVVENPGDATAWIGLGLDVVDIFVPCVSGLGEGARAARTTSNIIDAADDAVDILKATDAADDVHDTIKYTDKVVKQMSDPTDLHHAFPYVVDSMVDLNKATPITGGDKITRKLIQIPGSINGNDGFFEYIIEADGSCNHRFFRATFK